MADHDGGNESEGVVMSDLVISTITGDIDVSGRGPRVWRADEELEALAQRVLIKCRTFLGEWLTDTTIGLPWQEMLGSKSDDFVIAILRDAIQSTDGVRSITSLSSTRTSARELLVDIVFVSDDGSTATINGATIP
jgi:hypothetical protein